MLNSDQKQFFQENGYILLKGVFSKEEAKAFRDEAHALIERVSQRGSVEATWDSASKITMTKTQLKH